MRAIKYLPLEDVLGNEANPKAHDLALIDSSVHRFGFVEPLVRDERTGLLVSGHGRTETLRALQASGADAPEGVRTKGRQWLVPVVTGWSSRDDAEASAALIALNRATELGGWDEAGLFGLLSDLATQDAGLLGVGFADHEIDAIGEHLEALRNQNFLGDLSGQDVGNEFRHSGTWGGGTDEVGVTFAMSPAARTVLLERLNAERKASDIETLSEALFTCLSLEVPEPEQQPVEQQPAEPAQV